MSRVRSTTVVAVIREGRIAMAADGQVTVGDAIMKGDKALSPGEVLKVLGILHKHYPAAAGYGSAMCGGRGCLRACMVHLEKTEKLTRPFKHPFRKRKPWRL